jgi:hypothetical protein
MLFFEAADFGIKPILWNLSLVTDVMGRQYIRIRHIRAIARWRSVRASFNRWTTCLEV